MSFHIFMSIYNIHCMDTIIFQAKSQALLGHLLEKGYSKHYASLFSYEIGRMLNYISSYGSLDGYLQNYSSVFGMKLDSRKTRIINLIQGYLFNGQLPSRRHPLRQDVGSYHKLSETSRTFVDSYITACGGRWSSSTKARVTHTLSAYLLHFHQSGTDLSLVTEESVWAYFYDFRNGVALRGSATSFFIRRFLRWAGSQPGGECYARMLPMIPAMKKPRKAFDCLTSEEDSRLTAYVLGDGSELSLRDMAIFLVARFCGLRACDIAALRMSDIDLSHSRLSVVQRKTGKHLEMALRPVVGNAICRYVMAERPESDLPELFLIDEREVRPLSPGAVGGVCNKVYRLAGVRQDGGRRRGGHLLRHRFAQSLVEGGACDAAAMRLLGHSSPSSLDAYLETDHVRLRDCALGLSEFAIGKEALS